MAHDRIRLFEAAQAAGVPMPRPRPLSEVDEFDALAIIKARFNVLVGEYLDGYDLSEYDIIKEIRHVNQGDNVDRNEIIRTMKHDPTSLFSTPFLADTRYNPRDVLAMFSVVISWYHSFPRIA